MDISLPRSSLDNVACTTPLKGISVFRIGPLTRGRDRSLALLPLFYFSSFLCFVLFWSQAPRASLSCTNPWRHLRAEGECTIRVSNTSYPRRLEYSIPQNMREATTREMRVRQLCRHVCMWLKSLKTLVAFPLVRPALLSAGHCSRRWLLWKSQGRRTTILKRYYDAAISPVVIRRCPAAHRPPRAYSARPR